jgi:pyridoxamine 5'-phosphate oxidase
MDLGNIRKDYGKGAIEDEYVPEDPMGWFKEWLSEAIESGEPEATAMVLSTVSAEGSPSARVVLLKSADELGFVFFTNYLSRKGEQLASNPQAALTFFWPVTERQVRVEGLIAKTDSEESDRYFYSRPLESRVNAVISPQSKPIASRSRLEEERERILNSGNEGLVKRPANWGGYRLQPFRIEFWQGRPGRLHDRIQYVFNDGEWQTSRLAP